MPDRYANGDPSNDRGGASGGRSATGYDPADIGWYHGGDLKGLTGSCTDTRTGLARIKSLGFTAIWLAPVVVQQCRAGRQRRLPRLLGARLHEGRPAPRHGGRLQGVRRLRARPRAEALPRRRREPHRGRDPPLGRDDVSLARGAAVPRLQGTSRTRRSGTPAASAFPVSRPAISRARRSCCRRSGT